MTNAYVFRYEDKATGDSVYAVWSPTMNRTKIKDYEVSIDGNNDIVAYLEEDTATGRQEQLRVQNQKVKVDVSESPVSISGRIMKRGWLELKGKRYYFGEPDDEAMKTGWLGYSGDCYFFDQEEGNNQGIMLVDQWIDSRYLESDGKWNPDKIVEE